MIINKSILLQMLKDLEAYYAGYCIVESECGRNTEIEKTLLKNLIETIEKDAWVKVECEEQSESLEIQCYVCRKILEPTQNGFEVDGLFNAYCKTCYEHNRNQ